MWKDQFGQSLRKYLQMDHRIHSDSDVQAYQNLSKVKSKHGMWNKVAILCGATEKNVHDYFHNTWSKQFCDSYEEYKDKLNEQLLRLMKSEMRKSDVLNQLIGQLELEHPHKNFHTISLRQLLTHTYDRLALRNEFKKHSYERKDKQLQLHYAQPQPELVTATHIQMDQNEVNFLVAQLRILVE
ncbi:Conserved_hypothetical protein [Hexamita inflata]|uniref:Uncharacterized protein n=1 Tax=Hexamita inflata TaxID=28002 RepID=A0AA86RIC4_9EUKA|nr:Conserved hypothetical protein [Hexamita inflata]CAI9974946.1 Conserved hypothetical protein [Hexamita inflata]